MRAEIYAVAAEKKEKGNAYFSERTEVGERAFAADAQHMPQLTACNASGKAPQMMHQHQNDCSAFHQFGIIS